ncbi:MAG: hypothetical protein M0Q91_15645 [Methanoregula sp.]|jgi:hypothetical protein|nr:hypothetical protein [Methanoregula sp.]
MDTPTLTQFFEAFVGLIVLGYAYLQNRKATKAATTTQEVISYFNPGDEKVVSAPDIIPGRSYKMNDQTKRWLTFDHNPEEQEMLLRQVAEAEAEKLATYTITVPSCWYDIEYGLIKGSGKLEA